jgi:hypothetical protein
MKTKIHLKAVLFLSHFVILAIASNFSILSSGSSRIKLYRRNLTREKNIIIMPMQLRQRKGLRVRGGSSEDGSNNPDSPQRVAGTTGTTEGNKLTIDSDKSISSSPKELPVTEPTKSSASIAMTKIRNTIFPIYGSEVKKFLLMGAIKFGVIMALTLTRDTKDTLVVTQCGAEAIAFLKVRIFTHV